MWKGRTSYFQNIFFWHSKEKQNKYLQDVKRFKSSNLPSTHSITEMRMERIYFLCQSVEIFIEKCVYTNNGINEKKRKEGLVTIALYENWVFCIQIKYFSFFFLLTIIFILSQFFFSFLCVRWYGCVLCIVYWWIHSISKQTLFNILLYSHVLLL